jgi:hypothetical protein
VQVVDLFRDYQGVRPASTYFHVSATRTSAFVLCVSPISRETLSLRRWTLNTGDRTCEPLITTHESRSLKTPSHSHPGCSVPSDIGTEA